MRCHSHVVDQTGNLVQNRLEGVSAAWDTEWVETEASDVMLLAATSSLRIYGKNRTIT